MKIYHLATESDDHWYYTTRKKAEAALKRMAKADGLKEDGEGYFYITELDVD